MKKAIILPAMLFLAVAIASCGSSSNKATDNNEQTTMQPANSMNNMHNMNNTNMHHDGQQGKIVYTCSMHPEVISDTPGTCPKCGMDLVRKDMIDKNGTMQHMDSMHHDNDQQ